MEAASMTAAARSEDPIERLYELCGTYQEAHRNQEFWRLASLYADDAVVLPPSFAPLRGRDAVQRFYEDGSRKLAVQDMTIDPKWVEAEAGYGFTAGRWTAVLRRQDGSSEPMEGYYLDVVKKHRGEWKIVCETWNVKPLASARSGR